MKDFAGNSVLSARSIPVGVKVRDWIGKGDRDDYYKVTIGSRSSFNLTVDSKKAAAGARLIDSNGQTVGTATRFGKRSQVISSTLEAGTYYIRVSGRGGMTPYTLRTTTPSSGGQVPISAFRPNPEPGLSALTAFDAGILNGQRAYQDSINVADRADFYKFRLSQVSEFAASAGGLTDNIELNLYYDRNANGLVDGNERITSDMFGGAGRDAAIKETLGSGDYYVAIESSYGDTTPYTLRLSSSPVAGLNLIEPGNTPATSYQFGILNNPITVKDFVGAVDPVDFYTFNLNSVRDVSAVITTNSTDSVKFSLLQDANRNGVLDYSDSPVGTYNGSSVSGTLTAGDYFLRIQVQPNYLGEYGVADNAAYTLRIS